MKWIKRIVFSLVLIILIYIGAVLLFVFTPGINDYFEQTKFDSKTWIEWKDNEADQKTRWNMTSDLIKNHDLIGKSIVEIKKLLGKPYYQSKNEIS